MNIQFVETVWINICNKGNMTGLVFVKNNEILTNSKLLADKFDKPHERVLKTIDKLESEIENLMNENSFMRNEAYIFKEVARKSRGREFRNIEMNRNAFSLVAMSFTGKKALKWKMDFIKAFNLMEKSLLNRADIGWKQVRDDSKNVRLELTGCIKEFIEYAEFQGSTSPKRYYGNITKMEYVALRLLEYKEKVPSNFRDTLDKMTLFMIVMAEHVADQTIKQGMKDGLHYKEIFLLAKQAVINYAGTVIFDKEQID